MKYEVNKKLGKSGTIKNFHVVNKGGEPKYIELINLDEKVNTYPYSEERVSRISQAMEKQADLYVKGHKAKKVPLYIKGLGGIVLGSLGILGTTYFLADESIYTRIVAAGIPIAIGTIFLKNAVQKIDDLNKYLKYTLNRNVLGKEFAIIQEQEAELRGEKYRRIEVDATNIDEVNESQLDGMLNKVKSYKKFV